MITSLPPSSPNQTRRLPDSGVSPGIVWRSCNRPEIWGVVACAGSAAVTADPGCAVWWGQLAIACSGQYSKQARESDRSMTRLGRLTLIDWLCVDLCLIGLHKDSSFLCLASILPLVGFRLYDATGIPALGSSVMWHPADLEQSSQPARERLIEIPDPISDDLYHTLKELYDEVKSKLVGSDGQLYQSAEGMPSDVYSLGEHLFAKNWDGDRLNLRSVLEDLLTCPIILEFINVPVTMLTRSNQNMHSFEREAAQQWLINSNQRHPLTREPVVGLALDELSAEIIQLLLEYQPPPAQQSMADPVSQPDTPTDPLLASECPPC